LDQEFLDPEQASRLRKLMKAKGRDAVLDKRGFVKAPVLTDEAAEADGSGSSSRDREERPDRSSRGWRQEGNANSRTERSAGSSDEAPSAPAYTDSSSSSSSSRDAGRPRLFDPSQLQAAAPGSGGAAAALPIVRPGSSTAASTSSPDRAAAAAAAKSRSGSGSAAGFFSSSSWQELGASQAVQEAAAAVGVSRPSHIQVEAYKALSLKSGFKHVAVADQAGSGKTLAYLLPLLQQLKQREQQLGGPATTPNSPSIIILTPTTGENSWLCCFLSILWCSSPVQR